MNEMQERSAKDRCVMLSGKGFSVAESFERVAPTGEGSRKRSSPRSGGRSSPSKAIRRSSNPGLRPKECSSSRSGRSACSPLGATSIRIPYELVQDVELRGGNVSGDARSVIVKSCFGRFDIVTFPQSANRDPETTTEAAVNLKARLSAFRTAAGN
jgi:hypothetical protein